MNRFKKIPRESVYMIIIMVCALILRLITLGKFSFWHDEAIYFLTAQDIKLLLSGKAAIKGALFFQLMSYIWSKFSQNLFYLRLLPVIWSVLGVYLTFLLTRFLFNRETALIASFLLAISPLNIYYAQEYKMYSLMITLTLFSYYIFYRFTQSGTYSTIWRYLTVVNALLLHTHSFALLVFAVEGIFLIVFCKSQREKLTNFVVSTIGSLMLYLPWFLVAELQYVSIIGEFNSSWIPDWTLANPLLTLYHFSAGYSSPRWLGITITTIFLLLVVKMIIADLSATKSHYNKSSFFLILAVFVPIFVTSIVAQWRNIYLDRYLIIVTGPLLIVVARGLSSIRTDIMKKLIIIIITLTMIVPISYIYRNYVPQEDKTTIYMKKDVISAAAYLDEHVQSNDLVINSSWSVVVPLIFHCKKHFRQPHVVLTSGKYRHFSTIEGDFIYSQDIFPHYLPTTVSGYNRIWLVHSSWPTSTETGEARMVKEWMLKHFTLKIEKDFFGIDIFLFQPKTK